MQDNVKITSLSWEARLVRVLSISVLTLITLAELGALFRIPVLTLPGALATTLTSWFIILIFASVVAYSWTGSLRARPWTVVVAFMTLFTLFGSVLIEISLVRLARKNGIPVSILETFMLPHSGAHNRGTFVPYTTFNGARVNLVIYRPRLGAVGHPSPVLIYVHGGGWISGSADARHADFNWFADQGWLVISVDYTLSTKDQHLWDVTHGQIACSMAWVGTHAAQLGGDLSRLYMMGDSAGGNLAINASYMANADMLTSSCGGAVPHIRAVVAGYPVVDPAKFYKNPVPLYGNGARPMAGGYTGGAPEQYPERYRTISSFTYLTSGAPPTMILVGEHDNFVLPQPTYEFAKLARSKGVPIELIRVPYVDHEFDAIPHTLGNQIFLNSSANFMRQH